ncbi:hypothetical protein [Flavobacterium sp.]|uniref:hypothetical protein n=1 Tax=Flavobacterium sp. TaxID=239 RepID=UPI002FDDEDAF
MEDKLNLLDPNIPLSERYDSYLEWETQNSTISIQVIAQNLGIREAHVEVYFDLGKLDEEEFNTIDDSKIPIDHLFLIIKEDKQKRIELYNNYKIIVNDTKEPIKAIRNYIDGDNEPLFKKMLHNVSPNAYYSVSSYLKQRDIQSGTIIKGFRGCLINVGNRVKNGDVISDKQIDWIVKAIAHSEVESLNVFSNDILKNDLPDDYEIFRKIITEISKIK